MSIPNMIGALMNDNKLDALDDFIIGKKIIKNNLLKKLYLKLKG